MIMNKVILISLMMVTTVFAGAILEDKTTYEYIIYMDKTPPGLVDLMEKGRRSQNQPILNTDVLYPPNTNYWLWVVSPKSVPETAFVVGQIAAGKIELHKSIRTIKQVSDRTGADKWTFEVNHFTPFPSDWYRDWSVYISS